MADLLTKEDRDWMRRAFARWGVEAARVDVAALLDHADAADLALAAKDAEHRAFTERVFRAVGLGDDATDAHLFREIERLRQGATLVEMADEQPPFPFYSAAAEFPGAYRAALVLESGADRFELLRESTKDARRALAARLVATALGLLSAAQTEEG